MKKIIDDRITEVESKFSAVCKCGETITSKYKSSILDMLNRGTCKKCRVQPKDLPEEGIYKNSEGKWCSTCSCCGVEQAYTRKEHARNSYKSKAKCKSCAVESGAFSRSNSVGPEQRLYSKFSKSAKARGIEWSLTKDQMFENYNGKCTLTGWNINTNYGKCTASLDRIDSSKGYVMDNIQWVHTMVNMCKNKNSQEMFITMCKAVAKNIKD